MSEQTRSLVPPTDPIDQISNILAEWDQTLDPQQYEAVGEGVIKRRVATPVQQTLITIPGKERDTWLTPSWILDRLGRFDMDPCAADEFPSRIAPRYYTATANGLNQTWLGRIFMNPPFSNLAPWLDRMSAHGNGIALVPGNHETNAWTKFVWCKADAVLLLAGRPAFMCPDGKNSTGRPRQSTALIAYGKDNAAILSRSGLQGVLIWAWQQLGKASA